MKIIFKIIITLLLTIFTQIGGIIYIITESIFLKIKVKNRLKKVTVYIVIYVFTTFLMVPHLAPVFGRVKITENHHIKALTFFTKLCNRNYVTPQLNDALQNIALEMNTKYPNLKLTYLDANFPFVKKFPLLPHLSHSDGKKVDISFVYEYQNGVPSNDHPSIFGYGVYELPKQNEYNQTLFCKEKGYWQYDFAKYLTFGFTNKELRFSQKATKDLLLTIIAQKHIGKVFIEPHIKKRLHLENAKIRFHGCQAVRHDDHIHIQLK
ncbi:hypothetical protein GCM10022393_14890 [Aquimarina addita]|uniref:Uncharacterized protein n=1 Tax=Aquimarina addita TaxID=870485 RepID=A0ABP7XFW0_9FLAO